MAEFSGIVPEAPAGDALKVPRLPGKGQPRRRGGKQERPVELPVSLLGRSGRWGAAAVPAPDPAHLPLFSSLRTAANLFGSQIHTSGSVSDIKHTPSVPSSALKRATRLKAPPERVTTLVSAEMMSKV